jgi:hypothetical protein
VRLLLRGRATLDRLQQIALKLNAVHTASLPDTVSMAPFICWPFRL